MIEISIWAADVFGGALAQRGCSKSCNTRSDLLLHNFVLPGTVLCAVITGFVFSFIKWILFGVVLTILGC